MSFNILVLWMAISGGLLLGEVLNYQVVVIIFSQSLF